MSRDDETMQEDDLKKLMDDDPGFEAKLKGAMQLDVPELKMPELKLFAGLKAPEIKIPEVKLPHIKIPELQLPAREEKEAEGEFEKKEEDNEVPMVHN